MSVYDLYELFDDMDAAQLGSVSQEKLTALPAGVSLTNIKKQAFQRSGIAVINKKRTPFRWYYPVISAACLCVLLTGVWGHQNTWTPYEPDLDGENTPPAPGLPDQGPQLNTWQDFIQDFAGDIIVWGDSELAETPGDSPIQDPDRYEDPYRNWNGINISQELLQANNSNVGIDVVYAIGAVSLTDPQMKLKDFVYQGMTIGQLMDQRYDLYDRLGCLASLHKLTKHWDELDEVTRADVLKDIDPEFAAQYKTEKGYDLQRIEADDRLLTEKLEQNKQQEASLREAYQQQYVQIADLAFLSKYGYYVLKHNNRTFVFATAEELQQIAEYVILHNGNELLNNTVFTLATREEMGYISEDVPIGDTET